MTKLATIVGLLFGFAVLALGSVVSLGSAGAQTQGDGACRPVQVALDEGYGVTRTTVQSQCGD